MSDTATPDTQPEGTREKGFEDLLPLAAKRIAPGEYEVVDRDGVRRWYMEGASLAEWVVATLNGAAALAALKTWRESENVTGSFCDCGNDDCASFMSKKKAVDDALAALREAADKLESEG